MGYAELLKTVQALPKEKQSEVFDFVSFLAARCGVTADAAHGEWTENEFAELSLRQAMRGMEGEPAPYSESNAIIAFRASGLGGATERLLADRKADKLREA